MSLLTGLFSRRRETPQPSPSKPVDEMSLAEILTLVRGAGDTIDAHTAIAISRRLHNVAFYDHHVVMQDRENAIKLLESVNRDIEAGYANKPEALAAFREASSYAKDNVKYRGYGSLTWLIEENKVPTDQIVPFVMQPEHRHLLRNALHAFGSEAVAKARPEMTRELIRTRRQAKVGNGVLVLHGVACARDPAVEALFSGDDLEALRNAHWDYGTARNVLVKLGLLPEKSSARSLEPRLPLAELGQMVFLMKQEAWKDRTNDPEIADYLGSLDKDWMQAFVVARVVSGMYLAMTHIGGIYGDASRKELREDLLESYSKSRELELERWLDKMVVIENGAFETASFSPDLVVLDLLLHEGKSEQTEAEFEATKERWVRGGELLTCCRVSFLHKLRFHLRYHAAAIAGASPNESWDDFAEDCVV